VNQPQCILKNGARVKTRTSLDSSIGMIVPPQCLSMRRVSAEGIIRGVVGGHGGDLYYVEHEAHDLHYVVYCFTEFEVIS
jgi:hypothetical protein